MDHWPHYSRDTELVAALCRQDGIEPDGTPLLIPGTEVSVAVTCTGTFAPYFPRFVITRGTAEDGHWRTVQVRSGIEYIAHIRPVVEQLRAAAAGGEYTTAHLLRAAVDGGDPEFLRMLFGRWPSVDDTAIILDDHGCAVVSSYVEPYPTAWPYTVVKAAQRDGDFTALWPYLAADL